jgi:membrane protein DedA with SNARE-associated domain/rhodanese-related sulfurtransferase
MSPIFALLAAHGGLVLFAAVLVEQLGLPLPALPWMVAAGALAANGQLNPLPALAGIVAACLIADALWFELGRRGGARVLRTLCRLSLQPDSCVRRTRDLFGRDGMRSVIAAKFVPGLGTIVPPLAGMSGVRLRRYLWFDALGSLLYGGGCLLLGVLFRHQLDWLLATLGRLGNNGLGLLVCAAAGYVGFKYFQRHRLLRRLRVARITVDELRRRQAAGEPLTILDLRARTELEREPHVISGARHVGLDELERCRHELPRDRDIIVYCSCPNEASSASVALQLHRQGLERVRPLLGGIEAWRERDYPTERWPAAGSSAHAPAAPPAPALPASPPSGDSPADIGLGPTTKAV